MHLIYTGRAFSPYRFSNVFLNIFRLEDSDNTMMERVKQLKWVQVAVLDQIHFSVDVTECTLRARELVCKAYNE